MSEQITTFCGENIKNENLEVITDNPNFNFEVDPSFEKFYFMILKETLSW